MTILASSNVKTTFMNRVTSINRFGGSNNYAITLYSGAKPTAANYIANFNTSYVNSNASFLWHSNSNTVWSLTGNTMYLSVPPANAVPSHNGTATWAVLWPRAISSASMNTAPTPTEGFMIVDVSTTAAGTGVVQLQNTTLATTDAALTIDTAGFSIS